LSAKWFELGPFTIFDLETTGMSPTRDRIVEIAAIHVDRDGAQSRFSSLVNPCVSIPYQASKVHHITDDMVSSEPTFYEVANRFHDFARGSTLVAHNARFDLSFLQESLARTGHQLWKGKTLDSIPLIKRAYPGLRSYSLGYLKQHFGLGLGGEDEQAHRAYVDVEWTLEIFEMTMKTLVNASVEQ
jgi:DNA polymerase III epsilon subunit family exonuclease